MKYIRDFETVAAFQAAQATLDRPNVSLIDATMDVNYLPYIDPYNGYDYVDLGLPSGTKWATMNVGAESVTDYGLFFQWADTSGYSAAQVGTDKTFDWDNYKYSINGGSSAAYMRKYNQTDHLLTLETSDDAAAANMGGSWRMPTVTEFNELLDETNCTKVWTTVNGVNGYLFTSVTNSNTLFFPAAGRCSGTNVYSVGDDGTYWSNSLYTSNLANARYLKIGSDSCYVFSVSRCNGYSVRGVVG